mmetsp:Transcript_28243/g.27197  ORF Transcript_28243/g.27197 Transcript_28243/m.27197 type:complete len:80 (-) Transcript_28243:41-280(-)
MDEEKLAQKDADFEKKLGYCLQTLEKLKSEVLNDLDDLGDQMTLINYDNFNLFYQNLHPKGPAYKDEILEELEDFSNLL